MKFHACLAVFLFTQLAVQRGSAMDDISADLAAMIKSSGVPSLAAAAVFEGKIIAAGASGIRKQGSNKRVTISDKYHIGSCTKSMTAVLAAILVQEKKISWDTTIGEIFRSKRVHPEYKKVTLAQLLSNTGGCPDDIGPRLWSKLWAARGSYTNQRMLLAEGVLAQPPSYSPGTEDRYSNAGFSIAGAMLEQAGRLPYERMLRDKLFTPLGMKTAGFRAPASLGKVDQPYGHNPDPVEPEPAGDNPPAIAPAGAVHCSVVDFARYAAFHLGVHGKEILPADAIEFLHDPANGRGEYSMGWIITTRDWAGGKALTHTGSNTMFFSVIWIAPKRDFAVVAMCNTGEQEGFELCDGAIAHLVEKYLKD